MPPEQKLLYLYLFTSPSTNNLGVLSVTVRKIAFETGLDEDDVREFLEDLEFDGRIVKEDGDIWVCGFIRHQCSTSPKILTSLRALLPTVESAAIRRAILKRYPHLFEAAPYPSDRVSLPSGESEREVEKETLIRTPEREGASFAPPVEETPLPLHLLTALQRDFPDVDVDAEIVRIRDWQAKKRQPVRNWASFLRTWLSNAVRVRAAHAAPAPAAPVTPAVQPEQRHREPHRAAYPVFRIENRHGECLDSVRLIGHDREFAFAEFPAGVFQLRMSGNILPFRSRISVTINDFIQFGRSQVCKNDAPGDAVEKREVFIDRHADHEDPGIRNFHR